MKKGIKYGVKIINDVSGLNYDSKTINILKKYKIPFVIPTFTRNTSEICKINHSTKMSF